MLFLCVKSSILNVHWVILVILRLSPQRVSSDSPNNIVPNLTLLIYSFYRIYHKLKLPYSFVVPCKVVQW